MTKKALLFGHPFSIEIRTISPIISLKHAEFLALTPACGCAGVHPGGRRELWVLGIINHRCTWINLARPLAATKSEARNPKSETNSNDQKRQIQNKICERNALIIRIL